MLLQGYKAQCEPIIDAVATLVANSAARCESLMVEGVHLSINAVVRIMNSHPCVLPFLIYTHSEEKHKERFAVSSSLLWHTCGISLVQKVVVNFAVTTHSRPCFLRCKDADSQGRIESFASTI